MLKKRFVYIFDMKLRDNRPALHLLNGDLKYKIITEFTGKNTYCIIMRDIYYLWTDKKVIVHNDTLIYM